MRSHLVVAKVRGIEIGFHSSWLVLAALLVSSLAGHFSTTAPNWGGQLVWTTAAVTAIAVFVSLVLHELAHAAVARSRGIPVSGITLFALGGVAQIEAEAEDPKTEFWMGIAGPLVSLAIGVASWYVVAVLAPRYPRPDPIVEAFSLLAAANITMAIFNMIPGFPLDGGRLLRAALWGWTGDFMRATRLAARAGQAVGGAFLILGAARVVSGAGIGGLWLSLLGWFLLEAATAAHTQVELRRLLGGVPVRELMTEAATVEGASLLRDFVDSRLLRDGETCFVVIDDGRPIGLITAVEAAKIPRLSWNETLVSQAMRKLQADERLEPETSGSDALERMARGALQHLPVSDAQGLRGLISRTRLLDALETRRLL